MKKRIIAVAMVICFCFLTMACYYVVLSKNTDLKDETKEKLAVVSCVEGTITTEDGFVVSSADKDEFIATVNNPHVYSALIGPRISSPNKPPVYSNNVNDYLDITQANTLRNALFNHICKDSDGDGRGSDCVLTINNTLEEQTFNLISSNDLTKNCDTAVVILENRTGAIKTLISYKASFPEYDVNKFSENYETLISIKDMFVPEYLNVSPPGSSFKAISSIPVIENHLEKELYFDSGKISVEGNVISNYGGASYGTVSLGNGALRNSLNTYFIHIYTTRLNSSDLLTIAKKAMIGEEFETDLWPLPSAIKAGTLFETAQASFGQGVSATPIGMCAAFAGIINNGKILRPYLIDSLKSSMSGDPYYQKKSEVVSTLTDAKTCRTLLSYLNVNAKKQYEMHFAAYAKTGTAECGDRNAVWVVCGNEKYSLAIRCMTTDLTMTGSRLCSVADRLIQYADAI